MLPYTVDAVWVEYSTEYCVGRETEVCGGKRKNRLSQNAGAKPSKMK